MSKPNLMIMIFLVLIIASCTVPVKLPLPALPDYPKLTKHELRLLAVCDDEKPNYNKSLCELYKKIANKDQMCRGSIREHRSIIEATQ